MDNASRMLWSLVAVVGGLVCFMHLAGRWEPQRFTRLVGDDHTHAIIELTEGQGTLTRDVAGQHEAVQVTFAHRSPNAVGANYRLTILTEGLYLHRGETFDLVGDERGPMKVVCPDCILPTTMLPMVWTIERHS